MQYIYTMKGLGKVHPPDAVVLKDIWLSFFPGAKIGVLGLNGAGKSSLLKIMAGEDHEFIGEAFPADGKRPAAQRRVVALLDRRVERVHIDVEDAANHGRVTGGGCGCMYNNGFLCPSSSTP